MVFHFPSVSRSSSSESHSSKNHNPPYIHSPRSSISSFSSEFKDILHQPQPQADIKPPPPKSPKRFWAFSTQIVSPLPPIPDMPGHARSSSANSLLGNGAEIIRRPSEASRGMKQNAMAERRLQATSPRSPTFSTAMEAIEARFDALTAVEPRSAPIPSSAISYDHVPPALPVTAPLKTKSSRTSIRSQRPRYDENDRRATIKPPPRSALPPIPFSSHLLSVETRPAPTSDSNTIVTLEFAFSTDDHCKNDPVTLTLDMLKRGGGHLVTAVEDELAKHDETRRSKPEQRDSLESQRSGPGMTHDGETSEESELDSEYGLEALLRDEYLRSLMLPDSPSFLKDFPPPPPIPAETFSIDIPSTNKPRAQTRNQYAQQDKFPSPSSPFTARSINTLPLNIPPRKAPLTISTAPLPPPSPPKLKNGGGRLTEIRILLLRDSMPYHIVAQRLITGSFVNTVLHGDTNTSRRKKVEDEVRWLGMSRLVDELAESTERIVMPGPGLRHKKSGVLTGGQGYI